MSSSLNAPNARIAACFAHLQAQGRKALIPFVTAGFPTPESTPALMHAMVDAGADIIELGVPFSDPSADGPAIQRASDVALAQGVGLVQVLSMVQAFRERNSHTPVVLMGYANPIERYEQQRGLGAFASDAAQAGVDGVLVVDYPPEECQDFAARLRAQGLDLIFLLAPTSTEARMRQIAELASGYVYYVSLKGVTGSGALDTEAVARMLPRIRTHVHTPVGVGFGIRNAETAGAIAEVADAVIIGSKIIECIEQAGPLQAPAAVAAWLVPIRAALDASRSVS